MKEITTKDLGKLNSENFAVLMIWANGCHVCTEAKPAFDKLSNKFSTFDFYKMQLSGETMSFYIKFETPDIVKMEDVIDEDGDPILDANGKTLQRKARNENGEVIMDYSISVPKYYVFHGEEVSDDNPHGLLGKVEGHNLPQLESILQQIEEMSVEENNEQA